VEVVSAEFWEVEAGGEELDVVVEGGGLVEDLEGGEEDWGAEEIGSEDGAGAGEGAPKPKPVDAGAEPNPDVMRFPAFARAALKGLSEAREEKPELANAAEEAGAEEDEDKEAAPKPEGFTDAAVAVKGLEE